MPVEPETGSEAIEGTLYAQAMGSIKGYVRRYLDLAKDTKTFTEVKVAHVQDMPARTIILGGIDSPLDAETVSAQEVASEWEHMQAVPFDVERAITKGVYRELRRRVGELLTELEGASMSFVEFSPQYISDNPHMLPLLQRLADIPSKAELKRKIGSVSDNNISKPAAARLADLLNKRKPGRVYSRDQLLQSVEPTLEGIVRDLVGRVVLESIVASALDDAGVAYKREDDYASIAGVVYDFRADFVLPDEVHPKALIEVRKSSSRHASLYAKDKMFSAINWKGRHKDLLAVLVVDGEWTEETLKVMTKVFDYVVPLAKSGEVAQAISAYLKGDKTRLKWLIDFAIRPAN